jgi:hypothetical protein
MNRVHIIEVTVSSLQELVRSKTYHIFSFYADFNIKDFKLKCCVLVEQLSTLRLIFIYFLKV